MFRKGIIILVLLFVGCATTAADKLCKKGYNYSKKKQYDEAISCYNKAIEIDPTSKRGYGLRAFAYLAQKKWDQAITDFNKGLKYHPKSGCYYCGKARAYLGKNNIEQACLNFELSSIFDCGPACSSDFPSLEEYCKQKILLFFFILIEFFSASKKGPII